jgi:serine/threonine protein kinase
MGRPSRFWMPHAPRILDLHLRWRIAIVLFIAAFYHQQHLFLVSRQSLAAKYSSTQFDVNHSGLQSSLNRRDDANYAFQDELIANRDAWTTLGEGWEGKVFAYKGWVIKTFTPGQSPFRNCAPGTEGEKWPTEIAASLRFGGYSHDLGSGRDAFDQSINTTLDGFLPVKAYFKASTPPRQVPEWHLVTPLLSGGNLNTLARTISLERKYTTAREIDVHHRPTLERLFDNLQRLHEAGYCHDDIKPANIFVAGDRKWLLGDLGNVRHITHEYHSSRLWADNGQLEDCRANDAIRTLKSYLQFVRMAADDKPCFDERTFGGNEPLSRLFWQASTNAPKMSAAQLRNLSFVEHPRKARQVETSRVSASRSYALSSMLSSQWALGRAVDHAVETRMGEKLIRWWAMTGILGVPNKESCGF